MNYKTATYEEAKAAHARGENVEALCVCDTSWQKFDPRVIPRHYLEFRIAEPDPKPEPAPLKIEAGKSYRRVNGSTCRLRCLCTDAPGSSPYIFISQYGQISRYNSHDIGGLTECAAPYDNWQHVPAWAQWQAMDEDGEWWWYEGKPVMDRKGWALSSRIHNSIPSEYIPTNHTGDWTNSLQQRPE